MAAQAWHVDRDGGLMPPLVAMAPSGETFISRSKRHGLWIHLPPGAGGTGPLDAASADRAVADHGFIQIDRDFDTWDQLEGFRQEEAAKFAPPVVIDPADLDDEDVREMLEVARRWMVEGEASQSRRLLLRLLLVPATLADVELHAEIVAALSALSEAAPGLRLRGEPTDPRLLAARRRYDGVVAAA